VRAVGAWSPIAAISSRHAVPREKHLDRAADHALAFGLGHAVADVEHQPVEKVRLAQFGELVGAFAGTMELFPVSHVSVISGKNQPDGPISAIHPSAKDLEINRRIGEILSGVGAVSAATTSG